MIAFPDTSFLCALYRRQENSPEAASYFKNMPEALHLSSVLVYEFRQGVRFQVYLHSRDKHKGYSQKDCDLVLSRFQSDLDTGALVIVAADWPDVHRLAEGLSRSHTKTNGQRAFDIIHVATALHFGAQEFLTFDLNQKKLALAEKLKVRM